MHLKETYYICVSTLNFSKLGFVASWVSMRIWKGSARTKGTNKNLNALVLDMHSAIFSHPSASILLSLTVHHHEIHTGSSWLPFLQHHLSVPCSNMHIHVWFPKLWDVPPLGDGDWVQKRYEEPFSCYDESTFPKVSLYYFHCSFAFILMFGLL